MCTATLLTILIPSSLGSIVVEEENNCSAMELWLVCISLRMKPEGGIEQHSSDQPKEVIVKLAAKYHHLVRQHNSIRKQKNAAELYDEVRRENVLITSGHLHPTC